jgi:hypothetical protein
MVFTDETQFTTDSDASRIRTWLFQKRVGLLTDIRRNPFAVELALHTIENWYYSLFVRNDWQDRPLLEFRSYSRWRSGRYREWRSVVEEKVDPWSVPPSSRRELIEDLCCSIESSFKSYRHCEEWPSQPTVGRRQPIGMFLRDWRRKYCDIGQRFTLFGGVLAVEWQIRLVEEVIKFSTNYSLGKVQWPYPPTDFVLEMYVGGNSHSDSESAFLKHWDSYVAEMKT